MVNRTGLYCPLFFWYASACLLVWCHACKPDGPKFPEVIVLYYEPQKAPPHVEVLLERLYRQVCSLSGKQKLEKPTVWVVNDTVGVAGWYQNGIYIEQKALDIVRRMGKDSTKALAFVLGHELAHHFDLYGKKAQTNYAKRNMDANLEDQADLKSAFWCYLGGYPVKNTMHRLLDSLYTGYGLNHTLKGYPDLSQRRTAVERVQNHCDTLVAVFSCAKILLAAHHYEEAIACLEHIQTDLDIQFYEVLNMLGAAHLLAAVDMKGDYRYPILIHRHVREIKKITRGGGPSDSMAIVKHLKMALSYLERASLLDAEDETITQNKIAVYGYLEDKNETKKRIESLKNEHYKAFYRIVVDEAFDKNDTLIRRKLKSIPDSTVITWVKQMLNNDNVIVDLDRVRFAPPKFNEPHTVFGQGLQFGFEGENYILKSHNEKIIKIYVSTKNRPQVDAIWKDKEHALDRIYEPDGACWMTYVKGSKQSIVAFKKSQKIKTYYIQSN